MDTTNENGPSYEDVLVKATGAIIALNILGVNESTVNAADEAFSLCRDYAYSGEVSLPAFNAVLPHLDELEELIAGAREALAAERKAEEYARVADALAITRAGGRVPEESMAGVVDRFKGGTTSVEEDLTRAIDAKRPVVFWYTKPGPLPTRELRKISPYEIKDGRECRLVLGYDHDREDIRQFCLDRIDLGYPSTIGPASQYRSPDA